MATCEASLMEIPMVALASAGASLMPSPDHGGRHFAVEFSNGLEFLFRCLFCDHFVNTQFIRQCLCFIVMITA